MNLSQSQNQFKPSTENLFTSKNDSDDIRLGDIVQSTTLSELTKKTNTTHSFCLLGYPDDEGIKLNGGRPGAAAAPTAIRQALFKMTPPLNQHHLYDIGDLNQGIKNNSEDQDSLRIKHQIAQEAIQNLQHNKFKTISLGGGHDYGYPDSSGFLKAHLPFHIQGNTPKPIVLNFDAHLDVRPTTNGFNSGTPFYRLLNEFENQFEFAEIGLQPQCNSIKHREWALNKKAHLFDLKDIQNPLGLLSLFEHPIFSSLTKTTPVFISFDIDCLTSTEAPGCSQSWVTGLKTEDFLKFFSQISKKADVRGLGIYEVSPPLDFDKQTSKTAALIIYNYLFQDFL